MQLNKLKDILTFRFETKLMLSVCVYAYIQEKADVGCDWESAPVCFFLSQRENFRPPRVPASNLFLGLYRPSSGFFLRFCPVIPYFH